MSFEKYVAYVVGVLAIIIIIGLIAWRVPKKLKQEKYVRRWKNLQELCADSTKWAVAISEADDMLGEALKKRKIKGSNMGERMVQAQKRFTNNDAVWFGHKLRTKLDDNPTYPLSKEDVQRALIGLRQALKDIGAL